MACDPSRLDALLHGELDKASAAETTLHTRSCQLCARELALLEQERELFTARARRRAPAPAIRREVMDRCEKLAERARFRSRLVGGLGFALTLALVTFAPFRHHPAETVSEVNASFCDPSETEASFSRALHCGGGELVAQAETDFHACLVASPLLPGFGPDACE